MGYHAKAMACTKLVNNTQKAYKTSDFLKITDSLALNTVLPSAKHKPPLERGLP